jgi:hypothetical protein
MTGSPVTLVGGAVVDSWSVDWLLETGRRAVEVNDLMRLTVPVSGISAAVMRLGGGAEQERRIRACIADKWSAALDFEAAHVLSMAHKDDRNAYIDRITHRLGPEAAEALRAHVLTVWRQRRDAALQPQPETADV